MKNKYYRKYKTAIKPGFAIVAFIILSYLAGNIFWGRISEIRKQISSSSKQNDVLDERLNTLQAVIVEAEESSNLLSAALPRTNPAILILNHLSTQVNENNVRYDNLSVNRRTSRLQEAEISAVNISFSVYGEYENIYNFINNLASIAPIVNLESINIEPNKEEGSEARVRLTSFYAPIPTKLPPITSPLDDFTDNEKGTIRFIQGFARPSQYLGDFNQELNDIVEREVGVDTGKANPFEESI